MSTDRLDTEHLERQNYGSEEELIKEFQSDSGSYSNLARDSTYEFVPPDRPK